MAFGDAEAAFGGLQVVAQSGEQIVGVDAVGGEAQVADHVGGWGQQWVPGGGGGFRAQGAPGGVDAKPECGPPAGHQRAGGASGCGEQQPGDQDGAGVAAVEGEHGEHEGQRPAGAQRDGHPQPQRFGQHVGVHRGVVHPGEQLRGLGHWPNCPVVMPVWSAVRLAET